MTTRRSISRIVAVTRGRGCSAAGARFLRTEEAGGSIPPSSTRTKRLSGYFEACSGRSAAWLAHLLWEQGVEGSNPFAPTIRNPEGFRGNSSVGRATAFQAVGRGFESCQARHRPFWYVVGVAQSVRALDCGSRGWGFDSPRSPHFFRIVAPVAQWTERRTSDPLVAGSNPAGRAISEQGETRQGPLAQLAEHLTLNQGVTGSIPV